MEQELFPAGSLSMPGVAVIATDHRVVWANRALCDLLGYGHLELYGRSVDELTHPDDVHLDAALSFQLFAGHIVVYEIRKRLLHADGQAILMHIVAGSIRDRRLSPLYATLAVEPDGEPSDAGSEESSSDSMADDEMEKIRKAILG